MVFMVFFPRCCIRCRVCEACCFDKGMLLLLASWASHHYSIMQYQGWMKGEKKLFGLDLLLLPSLCYKQAIGSWWWCLLLLICLYSRAKPWTIKSFACAKKKSSLFFCPILGNPSPLSPAPCPSLPLHPPRGRRPRRDLFSPLPACKRYDWLREARISQALTCALSLGQKVLQYFIKDHKNFNVFIITTALTVLWAKLPWNFLQIV